MLNFGVTTILKTGSFVATRKLMNHEISQHPIITMTEQDEASTGVCLLKFRMH
jgi:hypothetical protein